MSTITDPKEKFKPYYNKDGIQEKPKQQYFYKLYINLPPNKRTVAGLVTTLKKQERQGIKLPYKYKERTLEIWRNKFDWDERYYDLLHKDCEDLEQKAIDFNKYMYDDNINSSIQLSQTLHDIDDILRDVILKYDIHDKTTSQNIIQLGHLSKALHDLKLGIVPRMNEIYAGIKILHEMNEETADQLEDAINELLE